MEYRDNLTYNSADMPVLFNDLEVGYQHTHMTFEKKYIFTNKQIMKKKKS